MPHFDTSRRVAHSAEDMFDLVADVDKYPGFVPLCQSLTVRGRRQQDDGTELLIADMTVAYRFIKETFTSRVVLDRPNRKILVEYLDGPFRHMENRWTFQPIDEGHCEVGFYIDYEFKSRTLSAVMGSVFDRAFRRFATAFEERADQVYGT
ncbi:type II toxin-antitoxin system RatA family toxin [Amorphus coralli]|uniref:type II toxin-antitoxin system RatA family toxin n=1 Tax=Amorphus coralli TaxID=340680 RepID=UPI000376AF76|nr:type II toxin-antitoxin system RatA family toxin [Amorphus coralli]